MDKYNIISILGKGGYAVVYKILFNKKFYALKVRKIFPQQKHFNTSHKIWRDVVFSKKMDKYKYGFMKLIKYEIDNNCNFKLDNKENKNYINYLNKYNICFLTINDIKDGTIEQLIYTLRKKQVYSMITQLLISIKLARNNGFYLKDIHLGNICYNSVDIDYILDYNHPDDNVVYKLNSYGYVFSHIDYDDIMSEDFINDEYSLGVLHRSKNLNLDIIKTLLQIRHKLYYILTEPYLDNSPIQNNYPDNPFINNIMHLLKSPDQFYLDLKLNKKDFENNTIDDFTNDLIYAFQNINNLDLIISYFYEKCKNEN